MIMKKMNGKYRGNPNNNNNFIYSLNYKFDSHSPAGKICGTALELIKKYNDLAKEAHSNNDYIEAEVFRQYAEHYRKIVTEINEKKAQRQPFDKKDGDNHENMQDKSTETDNVETKETIVEKTTASENLVAAPKKQFTVIEITEAVPENGEKTVKPRGRRPKKDVAAV